ncbi:hypothetical protein FACS1894211_16140 [Clostridia bacterium]|nr:hypothetical protein FACS1894211_16140 [Clostridia bacterium]
MLLLHGVKSDKCWVKDMEYNYFGYGFRVGWHAEGLTKYQKWFEDGIWCEAKAKYYNPYADIINLDYIGKFPEYKYSAYKHFKDRCIIGYLKLYEKYPQTEYLLKLGLHKLYDSVTVLKRVGRDKRFCKWLIAHKDELAGHYFYVGTVMRAYRTGQSLKDVQRYHEHKKKLQHDSDLKPIKDFFKGKELELFFDYIEKQNTAARSYLDYLNACNYLGLDMTLPKNRFPHDFRRWHDIRIDEYRTAKALADEKERAGLYRQFASVAEKYSILQNCKKGGYAVVIAASPAELMREGDVLQHCVGKMNYDQKVVREETLIFFVRNPEHPTVPFVTVEYSLRTRKVLQCHGEHNGRPDDTVMRFIHEVWLPYANRTIKKLLTA